MIDAIEAAMGSLGISEPNPSVGCIIVRDGEIIAQGATEAHGGRHAERVAIDLIRNKADLSGATLYVTLEPCSHHGRQPPCANFVAASGIEACIIGALDPNPVVRGSGVSHLREAGIRVEVSDVAEAAVFWHLPFIVNHLQTKPLVAAKWAQTADGNLAFDGPDTRRISNEHSRAYAHWLRKRYDAIMVGARTVLEDLPRLNVRECAGVNERHPTKVIFDPMCRIGTSPPMIWKNLWNTTFSNDAPTLLLVDTDRFGLVAADRQRELARGGFIEVVQIQALATDPVVPLRRMLDQRTLSKSTRIDSVMVEGGGRLLSLLIEAGVVDICHIFTGPRFGGGNRGSLSLSARLGQSSWWVGVAGTYLNGDVLHELISPCISELISGHVRSTRSAVQMERSR